MYDQLAMFLRRTLVVVALALALPAEARFGKSSSSSSPPSSSHGAAPVNQGGRGHGGTHGGSDVPTLRPGRFASSGYYSGYYVPAYGYGYGLYGPPVLFGASPWLGQPPPAEAGEEAAALRLTAGVRNLFDRDPPFAITYDSNTGAGSSWEPRVADPRGRSYVMGAEFTF